MDNQHKTASHLPRLDEEAPNFKAETTQGDRSLSDYEGKWLVLFSHPADFTPVCTTELVGFARAYDKFKELGTELLGLSIDSIFSHLAWIDTIKKNFDVTIQYPLISDVSLQVSKSYGMIHEGASSTATVRAVFIIDPEGILRAMIYYPMTSGRSIEEVLRLVRALQTADEYGVVTPEAWIPGDKVIVPPPKTQKAVENRRNEDYEYTDWYFCKTLV